MRFCALKLHVIYRYEKVHQLSTTSMFVEKKLMLDDKKEISNVLHYRIEYDTGLSQLDAPQNRFQVRGGMG